MIGIGTAGWSVPGAVAEAFPGTGPHLERYAGRFGVVEINSSFHRPHRVGTYARWAAMVPEGFRFAVKAPKEITHVRRLVGIGDVLTGFLAEARGLGGKLGPLLVQLPPSLAWDEAVAKAFFAEVRGQFEGAMVCEPRHASWFENAADAALAHWGVARVAADPARVARAGEPGGWPGLAYWRLHGSPRAYYSAYGAERLPGIAAQLGASRAAERWCIFDNTASGAAAGDALALAAYI